MAGGHSGIYQVQEQCGAVLRLLLLIFKSKQPRFTQTGETDSVLDIEKEIHRQDLCLKQQLSTECHLGTFY